MDGMGVVHMAEDVRLHRMVALKFLYTVGICAPSQSVGKTNGARSRSCLACCNQSRLSVGMQQLAEAHFFARDYTAFRDAAERAMALNPRNSHARAYLG